jgi:hypothetical protein
MYWTGAITWNNATFEQIKNSGSLRYFKNYKLLEKMMNYEAIAKRLIWNLTIIQSGEI